METFKILIVEDDESTSEKLAQVIRKEGFAVIIANNGESGIELLKTEKPDIVITDLKMPDMDGLEVMKKVKEISKDIPIILITAFGDTDVALTALREGALDYLKKPVDLNLLILSLGRAKEKLIEQKKYLPFPNILIVEDEKITRTRLARILRKEGWILFEAEDGMEALKIFQTRKIDIVLLDIKMPKKDGLTTLKEMRQITQDFEAIILSGFGDESSAIQAMHEGAINFLKKPIDLEQLIISVEKAIEKIILDRSLKFRKRELEIAKEIIAKITSAKEIVIDISHKDVEKKSAMNFAERLIDAMPLSVAVVGKNNDILYMNNQFAKHLPKVPDRIDKNLIDNLNKLGIDEISYETLNTSIEYIFSSPIGTIKNIATGKFSYITIAKIKLIDNDFKEDVVLLIFRGERK